MIYQTFGHGENKLFFLNFFTILLIFLLNFFIILGSYVFIEKRGTQGF